MLGVFVMDIIDTGLILNNIGNFNMKDFDGRLILQKTIYVLKSFGIDLGYSYQWYLHGAYSTQLAKVGFELQDKIEKIPDIDVRFADEKIQSRFDKFMEFMKDKKNNACLLEISASICFLDDMSFSKEEILKMVENKKPNFTKEQCKKMWDELEQYDVVNT